MALDPNSNRYSYLLLHFADLVRTHNKNGLSDLDTYAETVFCELLNKIYGWNLHNVNEEKPNYPAIDLADYDARIAVQVTAERSVAKIRNTLCEFRKEGFEKDFDHLIILVVRTESPTQRMSDEIKGTWVLNGKTVKRSLWNVGSLIGAMSRLGNVRLQEEIVEYLEYQTYKYPSMQVHLPPVPAVFPCCDEISFETALTQLEGALKDGKPIFISGVEGVGKTQLAFQFAWKFAPPASAFLFDFCVPSDPEKEAMRETILRARYENYSFDGDDPDRDYSQRLLVLQQEKFRGSMLIIDHFYRPGKTCGQLMSEDSFDDLLRACKLNEIQLVFTTPYPIRADSGYPYSYQGLSVEDLKKLMRKTVHDETVSEAELENLISVLDGHTMMADLVAKTIEDSWGDVLAPDILEALRYGSLNQEDYSCVEIMRYPKHNGGSIYEHIHRLYSLDEMVSEEIEILRWATLWPASGIAAKTVKRILGKDRKNILEQLVKRGWIHLDNDTKTLRQHPVIRIICREELEPSFSNCQCFLTGLCDICDQEDAWEHDMKEQIVECLKNAERCLPDLDDGWQKRIRTILKPMELIAV